MATHSSIFSWEIPWTEDPGGLQSMGLQRVRYDLTTKQIIKRTHGLQSPKIFIIWTFIEWVFRFLVIQLPIFFKKESKALTEKMINLRLCEHVKQRQGCTCPWSLHYTGPQCTWWSWDGGSYSVYEGELCLHLIVRASGPSWGTGGPKQKSKAQGKGSQRRLKPTLGMGSWREFQG